MKKTTIPGLAAAILLTAACEPSAVLPSGHQAGAGDETSIPEPVPFTATDETALPDPYDPGMGPSVLPSCSTDIDCLEDEACPAEGGCDGRACDDDRCVDGFCVPTTVEGCIPGFSVQYTYASCCAERSLTLSADGDCTFEIAGEYEEPCATLAPIYIQDLVRVAGSMGFFGWSHGTCVPGATRADFGVYLSDGESANAVSCEDGVCVGGLCRIQDGIWAAMPSNWHDGCGCE